ncbi:MAG: hypothetical protein A2857_04120 [Candidatus Levybacteria bacterium RIFCSPHIGHO2_01_FULL_36_15]|nr:MAG: hypothetical protein A2857_04120 [Candidatus Levybacteria bacterium RIFCSPHIGHO2_01_FULL_36_15]OGH37429.1 MAG: hypothetical protein A2905_04830 [Candidatus Levybacteria bacterium RIFCSPLOWO2_01_FULL_36_10]
MLETEASFEKTHNLLLHGTPERPQVVLPSKPTGTDIIKASNLASIPPVLDAIPRKDGRPYAIFDVNDTRPLLSKTQATVKTGLEEIKVFPPQDKSEEKPSINIAPMGILIVSDVDFADPKINRTDRQFQRLGQFQMLTETADQWERNLDGSLPCGDEKPTQRLLDKYRHIAASWYTNELSKEPLTKLTAEGIIQDRLPQTDVILRKVIEYIKKLSLGLTDIYDEADRILNPPSQKEIDPEVPKLESQIKDKQRQEDSTQKPDAMKKASKELGEKAREIAQSYEAQSKHRKSKDIYVHDPVMDEPSSNAAAYFEELWNRTF